MIDQAEVRRLLAEGFEVVQEGRVRIPFTPLHKQTFSDRAEGFDIHLLGTHAAPSWRSKYDNRLLDDDERWLHLRRLRVDGA